MLIHHCGVCYNACYVGSKFCSKCGRRLSRLSPAKVTTRRGRRVFGRRERKRLKWADKPPEYWLVKRALVERGERGG